jgi:nicotinamide-nucleotide amidase
MEETMRAEIITIGDELLIGQVIDTNSAWMAQILNESGIEVYQVTSVHDQKEHILEAIDSAFGRVDVVLTTGGLGPTKDDITKHVLCEYFDTPLVADADVEKHIMQLYSHRADVLNRLTATQWMVPACATILPNRVGSAPLMVFAKGEKLLITMPGVPYEMKVAMQEQVMPYLNKKKYDNRLQIIHRTCLVSGIAESTLALEIEDWEQALPSSVRLAYLPKDGIIRLRLSGYDANEGEVEACFATLLDKVSPYLLAVEDKPIEVLVGECLKQKGATIATAESCTGGRLAALLNAHSGSSAFYYGSVVAYDNSIKETVLGVERKVLEQYGAVSEPVVKQMAEGVKRLCQTDYAIATSGIAGPSGGSEDKPVGTVWIACAGEQGTECVCLYLGKERQTITERACIQALIKMYKYLQK